MSKIVPALAEVQALAAEWLELGRVPPDYDKLNDGARCKWHAWHSRTWQTWLKAHPQISQPYSISVMGIKDRGRAPIPLFTACYRVLEAHETLARAEAKLAEVLDSKAAQSLALSTRRSSSSQARVSERSNEARY
jgi:hypothetical protein